MARDTGSAVTFSKYEAHPFRPGSDPADSETCALCGESRRQIRHHPTRIAAACLLRGIDPATVLDRYRRK